MSNSMGNVMYPENTAPSDEGHELRFPRYYQIAGFLGLALGFIIPIFGFEQGERVELGQVMIFALFSLLGGSLLLAYRNHRCYVNDGSVIVYSWLNKKKEIKWDEVTLIKFQEIQGYINVMDSTQKLKIHFHVRDLWVFVEKMEEKTVWRAQKLKLPF